MIYDISYETLIDPKPLRIRFDKIDSFTRVYDGTRYLTLLGSEKYDAIYNRNMYLIIQHIFFFSLFCKNQSQFLWFFAYRKILTLHNVIIHIESVLNKEKCLYQLAKNNHKFVISKYNKTKI